jgi:hypothetical protein
VLANRFVRSGLEYRLGRERKQRFASIHHRQRELAAQRSRSGRAGPSGDTDDLDAGKATATDVIQHQTGDGAGAKKGNAHGRSSKAGDDSAIAVSLSAEGSPLCASPYSKTIQTSSR